MNSESNLCNDDHDKLLELTGEFSLRCEVVGAKLEHIERRIDRIDNRLGTIEKDSTGMSIKLSTAHGMLAAAKVILASIFAMFALIVTMVWDWIRG